MNVSQTLPYAVRNGNSIDQNNWSISTLDTVEFEEK